MDEEIISRVLGGSKEAFQSLVERYYGLVYSITYNITGDHQYAENLVQETFIQAYRSLHTYRNQGFKAWIGKIATHKAIDWKRKNGRVTTVPWEEELIPAEICLQTVEENIVVREEHKKLRILYHALPQKYLRVLQKFYIQEKDCRQIAREEGVGTRTVESWLYRARNKLRSQWKEDEEE